MDRARETEEVKERDELSGVSWMAQQFPPAKTRLLNPCCTGSDGVKIFSLWWYLTCCYCLHLLHSEPVNGCAPTSIHVHTHRRACSFLCTHTSRKSYFSVSQAEAESKQILGQSESYTSLQNWKMWLQEVELMVRMHTNTYTHSFLNFKCSQLFWEGKQNRRKRYLKGRRDVRRLLKLMWKESQK